VVLGIPSHIQMFVMEVVDRKELKVREEKWPAWVGVGVGVGDE
jgi:hypothetical protein